MTTLTQLITSVRLRADIENNNFIKDPEITDYINESCSELYDILRSKHASKYFYKELPISIIPNQSSYALPADFLSLLAVDYNLNGERIDIEFVNWKDRNQQSRTSIYGSTAILKYSLLGGNIVFFPKPSQGDTVYLHYVPTCPVLITSSPSNQLLPALNTYKEFIVVSSAIKCLDKQEIPSNHLVRELARITERVKRNSTQRDAGGTRTVASVSIKTRNKIYPWGE